MAINFYSFHTYKFIKDRLSKDELVSIKSGDIPGYLQDKIDNLTIILNESEDKIKVDTDYIISLIQEIDPPEQTVFIFKRHTEQPDTPIGNDPTGPNYGDWQYSAYPSDGTKDSLYMSTGKFVDVELEGTWSEPIKIDGTDGLSTIKVYKKTTTLTAPATPTTTDPTDGEGWYLDYSDITDWDTTGNYIWVSLAVSNDFDGTAWSSIVGDWSAPRLERVIGQSKVSYIFKRAESKPSTPTALDPVPETWNYGDWKYAPYNKTDISHILWMSQATIFGDNLIETWTEPIALDESGPGYYKKFVFKASETPLDETDRPEEEVNPTGWFDDPYEAVDIGGDFPVYISMAVIKVPVSGVELLTGQWSIPYKYSGEDGEDGVPGEHAFNVYLSPSSLSFNTDEYDEIKQDLTTTVIRLAVFSGNTEYFFDDSQSPAPNTYTYSIESTDNIVIDPQIESERVQFIPTDIPNKVVSGGGFVIKVFDNNSAVEQETEFNFGISRDGEDGDDGDSPITGQVTSDNGFQWKVDTDGNYFPNTDIITLTCSFREGKNTFAVRTFQIALDGNNGTISENYNTSVIDNISFTESGANTSVYTVTFQEDVSQETVSATISVVKDGDDGDDGDDGAPGEHAFHANLLPGSFAFSIDSEGNVNNLDDGKFEVSAYRGETIYTFDNSITPAPNTYDVEVIEEINITVDASTENSQRVFTPTTVNTEARGGSVLLKITDNTSNEFIHQRFGFSNILDGVPGDPGEHAYNVRINPETYSFKKDNEGNITAVGNGQFTVEMFLGEIMFTYDDSVTPADNTYTTEIVEQSGITMVGEVVAGQRVYVAEAVTATEDGFVKIKITSNNSQQEFIREFRFIITEDGDDGEDGQPTFMFNFDNTPSVIKLGELENVVGSLELGDSRLRATYGNQGLAYDGMSVQESPAVNPQHDNTFTVTDWSVYTVPFIEGENSSVDWNFHVIDEKLWIKLEAIDAAVVKISLDIAAQIDGELYSFPDAATQTYLVVKDGQSGYTAFLTNDNFTFRVDSDDQVLNLEDGSFEARVFYGSTEFLYDGSQDPAENTYDLTVDYINPEGIISLAESTTEEGHRSIDPVGLNVNQRSGSVGVTITENNSGINFKKVFNLQIQKDAVSSYTVNINPRTHEFLVNTENEVIDEEDGAFEIEAFYGEVRLTYDDTLNPASFTYDVEILEQVGVSMVESTVDGQRVLTPEIGSVDSSLRSGSVKVKITSNDSALIFVRTYKFRINKEPVSPLIVTTEPQTHIYSYYHGIVPAKQNLTVIVPRTYTESAGKMMDLRFSKTGETDVVRDLSVATYRMLTLVEWVEVFNEDRPFGSVYARIDTSNFSGSFLLTFYDDRGDFTLTTETLTPGFSVSLGSYQPFTDSAELIDLEDGYATVHARWGNVELTCPDTSTTNPTENNTYKVTNITLDDVTSMSYTEAIVNDQFQIQPITFSRKRATFTIVVTAMLGGELVTRIVVLRYGKVGAIKGDDGRKGDRLEHIYRQAESQPDTPSQTFPNNWYTDPAEAQEAIGTTADSRLWMSLAYKGATGTLTTNWTEPVALDGPRGISIEQRYKEGSSQPNTPTGNDPTAQGWSTVPPVEPSNSIWVSVGYFDGNNELIDSWSSPTVWSDRASLDFSELLSSMEDDIIALQGIATDHNNRLTALEEEVFTP